MWYFYKSCRFKRWIISSVQTISNAKTLKCSIKSMESIFNIRPFSEKMENYEIYIFVPNSQNLELIKSLILNIESAMIWQTMHQWWFDIKWKRKRFANSKSQLHIWGADYQLFEKQSKQKWRDSILKKQEMSECLTNVIKICLVMLFLNSFSFFMRKKSWMILGLK